MLFRSASSRVLINGVPERIIEHCRGLRQDDSLSPFLFDLAMEPMHCMLKLATEAGILTKLRGKKCTFKAPLYADDIALILNPSEHDIAGISAILAGYGRATGLITNLSKSSIMPICCSPMQVDSLASFISVPVTSFPCTYLGCPSRLKNSLRLIGKRYLIRWVDISLLGRHG
jgi:hypothetical protein